jgi:hypothetical protein
MDQSNPKNYLESEREYFISAQDYFKRGSGSFNEKSYAFPRFVPRQSISYFLARNEAYQKILGVHGSILDFGVHRGASFFTWMQLSSIYEPYNHNRKIVGFDSFEGFSELGDEDIGAEGGDLVIKTQGGMVYENGAQELREGINLMDLNRPLGHVPKGSIVEGGLPDSCEQYLKSHQQTIIAMANFGLGLYEPTLKILRMIKPRLINGSVLVFEDLNQATWPGETCALFEVFNHQKIKISRSPHCPHISWVTILEGGD